MVFSSVIFLYYFIPAFFLCYYLVPGRYKNVLCLLFSLAFYAWGEPYYILLMLASIAVNYFLGLGLDFKYNQRKRRAVMIIACAFNIGLLGVFKYASFFGQAFLHALGSNLTMPQIALPLGISFYTFQILSYVLDVYRKQADVQRNPLNLALYVSMFPQLVAGPIVRYNDVNDEIHSRRIELTDVVEGIIRFTIGLSKKILLANSLGILADTIWNSAGLQISTASAWIGLVAYALQIYFDFGGYSDMAIGLGWMMGFHFNENFNYPYISVSVSEFWRRWHISLGSWFRDYVYFPLGGSRTDSWKVLRNLLVVWALTGLWHGANWTFLLWGLYYGVLICIEKVVQPEQWRIPRLLRLILCLFLVVMGWVLFRSDSVTHAVTYFSRLFGAGAVGGIDPSARLYFHDNMILLLVAIVGSTPLARTVTRKMLAKCNLLLQSVIKGLFVAALLGLCTVYLVNATYNPFIYFRF